MEYRLTVSRDRLAELKVSLWYSKQYIHPPQKKSHLWYCRAPQISVQESKMMMENGNKKKHG
jgi:hypothetical protein